MKKQEMKKYWIIGAAVLCATVNAPLSTQAAPASVSTRQGKGADAHVRGGESAALNFGSETSLHVKNTSALMHARKIYLRFDLSSLPSPAKGAKSVTLTLTISKSESDSPAEKMWTFEVFGLKDAAKGEDWDEKTITWLNAPANDLQSGSGVTDDATSLGTFTVIGKGELGQTVTLSSPELLRFLQSDTNGLATLIVTRREVGESGPVSVVHRFAPKESPTLTPPTLSISFD